jgi:hypothetical protein
MRTSLTCRLLLLTIAALANTGCISRAAPNAFVEAAGGVESGVLGWSTVTDQTVILATRGTVDVDIDSFAGPVTIVTDSSLKETTIAMRRVASFGWGRDKEAEEALSDIHYTVSLQRNEGRDVAVVRATTEHPETHFQSIEITVTVPELGSVRTHTSGGDVWVESNRGPADIVTSRGGIRVMTPWKMSGPITLVTCDGDVDLRIRGESTGSFDAASVGGAVKSRVRYGKWLALDQRNSSDVLFATLNEGTNPVVMRTSNGDVMISVINDPISDNPFPGIW